jgi:hypothetical protein
MPENFAFLDTPIFLHYRPFDEIDWLGELGQGSVCLVLAPITISELNDKKDEPTPKLRQRAGTVLKKFEQLWAVGNPAPVRSGVEALLQDVEPSIDYARHQLDYRSQDDRLLAAILEFRETVQPKWLILVTADFGLRVKAKRHGIESTGLPDVQKLPDEPDANEKRIQQLEREVLELRRATPTLELTFADGSNILQTRLEPITISPEEIRREKERIRLEHRKWGDEPDPQPPASTFAALARLYISPFAPRPEDIAHYNQELKHYYTKFDRWVENKELYLNRERLTVKVALILSNTGTAPAGDIDIFLHFPDGFDLFTAEDLPMAPEEPQPPQRPSGRSFAGLFPPSALSGLHIPSLAPREPRNTSYPSVRRTNSFEVHYKVRQLKHHMTEGLDPLYLVFETFEDASPFSIDFRIVAGNVPKPVTGKLHVVVKK